MKSFNQVISVEVSVDSIAQELLNTISPDYAHREILVEGIIGRAISSDKQALAVIFNSLRGYTGEIDFKVGDVVVPGDLRVYAFWTPKSIEENNTVYGEIKSATIVEIDTYANEKLKISYEVPAKDGSVKTETKWYSHLRCNKFA